MDSAVNLSDPDRHFFKALSFQAYLVTYEFMKAVAREIGNGINAIRGL